MYRFSPGARILLPGLTYIIKILFLIGKTPLHCKKSVVRKSRIVQVERAEIVRVQPRKEIVMKTDQKVLAEQLEAAKAVKGSLFCLGYR